MIGGPWYNTSICKKLHGNVFEGFIRNARTDRNNILCYINAHEKLQYDMDRHNSEYITGGP